MEEKMENAKISNLYDLDETIANIIIMRHLNGIENNIIFQFCGIADNRTLSYDRTAADKCAVTDFCILINDQRTV